MESNKRRKYEEITHLGEEEEEKISTGPTNGNKKQKGNIGLATE